MLTAIRNTAKLLQSMIFLSEGQVRQCLSMKDCIKVNREALVALASKQAQVPSRLGLRYAPPAGPPVDEPQQHTASTVAEDWTLIKPAAYTPAPSQDDEETEVDGHGTKADKTLMGLKVVSIRANNPSVNLPLVPATVLSLDAATGLVNAVLGATYLTAARTAAGSALATELVRQGQAVQHLVVFGAGLQAEMHVRAIASVMGEQTLPLVTIVNRGLARAEDLKRKMLGLKHEDNGKRIVDECQVKVLHDALGVSEALITADVIVTATNTTTPLFDAAMVPPGCHINGIGSYTPEMQEVSARVVERCSILLDTPEARRVGDLQSLTQNHPVRLIGRVLQDPASFEDALNDKSHGGIVDCTFYKAVGTAVQDIMTADIVVRRAQELGIGTEVAMD